MLLIMLIMLLIDILVVDNKMENNIFSPIKSLIFYLIMIKFGIIFNQTNSAR